MDEAAALLLAQILGKHGIGVRAEPAEVTTRSGIASFDPAGAAMIWLCVLDAGAQAAHLRFACRRLRRVAPGIPIAVLFWPQPDAENAALDGRFEARLRDVVKADFTVPALHDAVELCLREATLTRPDPTA